MSEDDRSKLRDGKLAMIFQDFKLFPGLNVLENIWLPLKLLNIDNPFVVAEYWAEKVGLKNRLNHLPTQLSGGEAQRVAIARAFAQKPFVCWLMSQWEVWIIKQQISFRT